MIEESENLPDQADNEVEPMDVSGDAVDKIMMANDNSSHGRTKSVKRKAEMNTDIPLRSYNLREKSNLKRPKRFDLYEMANVCVASEPCTYDQAINCEERQDWKIAIDEEFDAYCKNATCNIKGYKARLCVKGCKQKFGVNYEATYAPVVRYDSLRILFALAAQLDLELVQFDVKTAFLYGELDKPIYVKIPHGLEVNGIKKNKVCRLKRAVYGLKQAARCWNKQFCELLKMFGFVQCELESSVFICYINGKIVILAIFVDDGMIFAHCIEHANRVISALKEKFEIVMGEADMFVGIQITRDRENRSIILHQEAYANRVLERFNVLDAPCDIPADPNTVLCAPTKNIDLNVPYREAIGSLMFLSVVTRPDLAYIVNFLSRYMCNFDRSHWRAVQRVLKYLKQTPRVGLCYSASDKSQFHVKAYSDADFGGDRDQRRSTSGCIIQLVNGPIIWCSKGQTVTAQSTAEAEYIAANVAAREMSWLRYFLNDLGFPCANSLNLYMDNTTAISWTKDLIINNKTKHIEIKYHYVRQKVQSKEINTVYVPTHLQLADLLTKNFNKQRFVFLRESIGMK